MADLMRGVSRNHSHIVGKGMHLPSEIICNILSRLPMKSILRCKTVCKTWYYLIQDPHFVNLQLSRTIDQPSRLVLLKTAQNRLLLMDREGCKIGEIHIAEEWLPAIMGSYNGMLCVAMVDELDPVHIWNPITREYIVLPESESQFAILSHHVDIGFDPKTQKYKVVRVYNEFLESNVFKFEIITLGESSWRQLDTPFNVLGIGKGASIFLDGCFYWILITEDVHSWDGIQILLLDVVDEEFKTTSFPPNVKFPLCEPLWVKWSFLNLGGFLSLSALDCRCIGQTGKCHGYQLLHVWQLMTNDAKSLHIQYQHTCKLYSSENLSYKALISKGDNGSYLLKAYTGLNDMPRLVQYFTKSETHLDLEIPGSCYWHTSTSFEASLLSPNVALPVLP